MTRRERWLWAALAAALLATRLVGLGDRAFSHDESLHGFYSWQLATRGLFAHDPMMHGPLLFHLNALLFRLVGASDGTARLTAALAGIGAVLLFFAFRRLLGRRAALAGAALAALSPSIWFYSRYMRNETYVALACLLWLLGAMRYLERRRGADLATMVLGMGLAFAAKEVAFLFGLTFGLFLVGLALSRSRRGGEALRVSAEADLALVMGVLVAPFLGALLYLPLGWSPTAYDAPEAARRALSTCGGLALVALAFGLAWLRGRSHRGPGAAGLRASRLALLAGAFWGATAVLFTTLGTNFPRGMVSGYVGSLGYWLAQHGVKRGGQPWFYYLMLVFLYELLPLLCALLASGPAWRRLRRFGAAAVPPGDLPEEGPGAPGLLAARAARARRSLLGFLLWWSGASVVLYSLAGEKMPWLTVHIVLPWCLLGGWGVARALEASSTARIRRLLLVTALSAGAIATGLVGGRLVFRDYDLATEMLVYAHGTPDLHRLVDALTARQRELPPGGELVVAHDSPSSWPLLWYLRETERRYLPEEPKAEDLTDVHAVLLAPEGSRKAWALLAREFEESELLQLWWPLETYREPARLLEKEARDAVLEYVLRRRVSGVEVGPHWPLRQELRLWMRRDGAPRGAVPTLAVTVLPFDLPRSSATIVPVPVAVAADEAGRVAVGDAGGGRVLTFDRTLRPLATFPLEGRLAAQGLAFGEDGRLAVGDPESGRVTLFDGAGHELARWPSDGTDEPRRPVGLVAVADGFVALDELRRELCPLDAHLAPHGGCLPLDFAPQAVAADAAGLLLADSGGRRLVALQDRKVTASWRVPGWEGLPESGRPGLARLDGWTLATDPMARRLLVFDAAGEIAAAIEPLADGGGALWVHPSGLAVDPSGGRLLLADRDAGRLYVLPLAALRTALATLPASSR